MSTRLLFFLLLVSLSSCFERMVDIPEETIGLAPIYGEESDKLIQLMDPQPIVSLYKIYYSLKTGVQLTEIDPTNNRIQQAYFSKHRYKVLCSKSYKEK